MKRWQDSEIEFLKENYPKSSTSLISKELDRSKSAVRSKASRLDLKKEEDTSDSPLFSLISGKKKKIQNLQKEFRQAAKGELEPDMDDLKKMKKDGMVRLGLNSIKSQIASTPYSISASKEVVRDVVKSQIEGNWNQIVSSALRCLDFGHSPNEIRYNLEDIVIEGQTHTNIHTLDLIYPLSPEDVSYVEREGEIVGFEPKGKEEAIVNEKAFWTTFESEVKDPKKSSSFLTGAYKYYKMCEELYQMMSIYAGTISEPTLLGKAPKGKIETDKGEMTTFQYMNEQVIGGILDGGIATIPSQPDKDTGQNRWGIDYMTPPVEAMGAFTNIIRFLEQKKINALLMTSQQNAAQFQQMAGMTTQNLHNMIIRRVSEGINRLVNNIVTMNFGEGASASIEFGASGNQEFLTGFLRTALQMAPETIKETVDFKALVEQAGIPTKTKG